MTEPPTLGPYRLHERIGAGGMGTVYRAEHLATSKVYALKILDLGNDAEAILRFGREGEAQARVDAHPNVARVHALEQAQGKLYLVMDLLPGGDLAARLKAGPLDPRVAAEFSRDLALGLAHAHAAGVLHRDVKPANILFDEDGVPKLVDFGLAYISGRESLTQTGTILGTPAFMAPEQATAAARVGPAADVYGLGASLYAMLTGQAPFVAGSLYTTLAAVLSDPPVPVSQLRPDVEPTLEAICMRCLAKAPEERYASATALAEALSAYLDGEAKRRSAPSGGLLAVGVIAAAATAIAIGVSSTRPVSPTKGEGGDSAALSSRVPAKDEGSSAAIEQRLADFGDAVRAVASAQPESARRRALAKAKELAAGLRRDRATAALTRAKVQAMEGSASAWGDRLRLAPRNTLFALLELAKSPPAVEVQEGGLLEEALTSALDSIASSERDDVRARALEVFVELRDQALAPNLNLPPEARTQAEAWLDPLDPPKPAFVVAAARAMLRAGSAEVQLLDMSLTVTGPAFKIFSDAEPPLVEFFKALGLRRGLQARTPAEVARVERTAAALLAARDTAEGASLAPVYWGEVTYRRILAEGGWGAEYGQEVLEDLSPRLVVGLTERLVGGWARRADPRSRRLWRVTRQRLSSWDARGDRWTSNKRRHLIGCLARQAASEALAGDLSAAQDHLDEAEAFARADSSPNNDIRDDLVSAQAYVARALGGAQEAWNALGERGLARLGRQDGARALLAIQIARRAGHPRFALQVLGGEEAQRVLTPGRRSELEVEIREEVRAAKALESR